jgi:hypothetical protein
VLCESDDYDLTLYELEPFYIKIYGSFGKYGYNLTPGGDKSPMFNIKHKDETKKKISETKKNNPIRYWLGKTRSKQDREKFSIAATKRMKGNTISKGRIWVTNGEKNKMVYPESIPSGYYEGQTRRSKCPDTPTVIKKQKKLSPSV